jgi:hypothetical protein
METISNKYGNEKVVSPSNRFNKKKDEEQALSGENQHISLEAFNSQFNDELQRQIEGTLPKGHVYKMGMPGEILQSAGMPNVTH